LNRDGPLPPPQLDEIPFPLPEKVLAHRTAQGLVDPGVLADYEAANELVLHQMKADGSRLRLVLPDAIEVDPGKLGDLVELPN